MRRLLALAFVVGTFAACSSSTTQAPSKPPTNGAIVIKPDGAATMAPYADAGATFAAKMDEPIDTMIDNRGKVFQATLTEPIRAQDGTELVPAGTKLLGHVVSTGTAANPEIVLAFDAMRLSSGDVPIGVRLLSAEQSRYATTPLPTGVSGGTPPAGAPGAQAPQGATQQQPVGQQQVRIMIPRGGALRLSLTRPIVAEKTPK